MYLDLPSVAQNRVHSGLGKVSGWMIWIPRERLSAFWLQVYLDLSSVAECVLGGPPERASPVGLHFGAATIRLPPRAGRVRPQQCWAGSNFLGATHARHGSLAPRKWLPARCGASRQSSQDLHEAQLWYLTLCSPDSPNRRALSQCYQLARYTLSSAVVRAIRFWGCRPARWFAHFSFCDTHTDTLLPNTAAKSAQPTRSQRSRAPRTAALPRNSTPAARRPPRHRPCNARRSRSDCCIPEDFADSG